MHLVSIIIPCYNQAKFLSQTLKSVQDQTYEFWECILVNDGSTDNTEDICKYYCSLDARFKYYKKENGGLSSARNFGLLKASGHYIQFLDSDDLIEKSKIEIQIQSLIRNNTEIDICDYCLFESQYETVMNDRISPFGFTSGRSNLESIILNWEKQLSIPCHCVIYKSAIAKNILFNEELRNHEDWVYWVQLFDRTELISFTRFSFAKYRVHPFSMSRDVEKMRLGFLQAIEYLQSYFKKAGHKEIHKILQKRKNELNKRYNFSRVSFFILKLITPPLFRYLLKKLFLKKPREVH